ncbi:amidohydrolase [Kribbella pittospori]|uniref:Amidohydrolase n=1 Tax=Kribbella pittospori TaxID=722689 RepID=A0A4V2M800_9ACTN|nr:amidohydrolase family protein [Kribbella pittospori]TCC49552.1 amidohydrolase [Kribbella pittospori]
MRVDAHQHFWDPARYSYPWMAGAAMDPVRRAFGPNDLRDLLIAAGIDRTVLVQTLSDLDETRGFLRLDADFVAGVVGWVDLTSPIVDDELDELLAGPGQLIGIRHQVHDELDSSWLLRDDVRRGLAAVQHRGLAYDVLVRARELPAAIATARGFPDLQFVLDHIAKPRIADGSDAAWTELMPGLAAAPNVAVKLSGMVTEADWSRWTADDLRPFVERVVDWFGTDRVLFGSDWPVCLLAGSYGEVLAGVEAALPSLSAAERELLYGGNAERVYSL